MVTDKIKELEATKRKLAQLEKSIAVEFENELAALPAKFGFDSAISFLKAVKAATSGSRATRKSSKATKRTRAVITNETKAKVKELV